MAKKKIIFGGKEKILIVKCDRIGDGVWTLHFVKLLKAAFPEIEITLVCNDYNRFIFDENSGLFQDIIEIDQQPPYYLIKQLNKLFFSFFRPINILFGGFSLWKSLKSKQFDYVFNLTGRDFFLVTKFIGKNVGGGLGIFNFLYSIPIVCHNEIGTDRHVIQKWLESTNIPLGFVSDLGKRSKLQNILLFIGGKQPNSLSDYSYKFIYRYLIDNGYKVDILSDKHHNSLNFVLTKNKNGLYVENQRYEDFLKNYDIFIGVDGGITHYSSLFMPSISFYTSTNVFSAYPFGGSLKLIEEIKNVKFYITDNNYQIVISSNLPCNGCFQIGCMLKKCGNFIDNEIEIIIKRAIKLSENFLR